MASHCRRADIFFLHWTFCRCSLVTSLHSCPPRQERRARPEVSDKKENSWSVVTVNCLYLQFNSWHLTKWRSSNSLCVLTTVFSHFYSVCRLNAALDSHRCIERSPRLAQMHWTLLPNQLIRRLQHKHLWPILIKRLNNSISFLVPTISERVPVHSNAILLLFEIRRLSKTESR